MSRPRAKRRRVAEPDKKERLSFILPKDPLVCVLGFLDMRDLCKHPPEVCRTWRDAIAQSPNLFRTLCFPTLQSGVRLKMVLGALDQHGQHVRRLEIPRFKKYGDIYGVFSALHYLAEFPLLTSVHVVAICNRVLPVRQQLAGTAATNLAEVAKKEKRSLVFSSGDGNTLRDIVSALSHIDISNPFITIHGTRIGLCECKQDGTLACDKKIQFVSNRNGRGISCHTKGEPWLYRNACVSCVSFHSPLDMGVCTNCGDECCPTCMPYLCFHEEQSYQSKAHHLICERCADICCDCSTVMPSLKKIYGSRAPPARQVLSRSGGPNLTCQYCAKVTEHAAVIPGSAAERTYNGHNKPELHLM